MQRRSALAGLVSVAIGLVGCGSTGTDRTAVAHRTTTTAGGSNEPRAVGVIAQVGATPIGKAAYERSLRATLNAEPASSRLVPPAFAGCIASLKAIRAEGAELPGHIPGGPKQKCEAKYKQAREGVLAQLISGYWIIGGAEELGVAAGAREVEHQVTAFARRNYPAHEQYLHHLRSLGRTEQDQSLKVTVELDSEAIRAAIKRRVGPITSARVESYYRRHKGEYHVPDRRDIEIVRTASNAQAQRAKRRLASGESVVSVLKGNLLPQPIFSKDGRVKGYHSNEYAQAPLNDAIMGAKPAVLVGPIHISLGYYVFRVARVIPGYEEPLSTVAAAIRRKLPEELQQQALAAFIAGWRRRWVARTDCDARYVNRKCRQYAGSRSNPPEDPYTLN